MFILHDNVMGQVGVQLIFQQYVCVHCISFCVVDHDHFSSIDHSTVKHSVKNQFEQKLLLKGLLL